MKNSNVFLRFVLIVIESQLVAKSRKGNLGIVILLV